MPCLHKIFLTNSFYLITFCPLKKSECLVITFRFGCSELYVLINPNNMMRLATLLILSLCSLGWLHSQQLKPRAMAPDGTVFSMKKHGNILYVGGAFDQVGYETGGGALYGANSLKPDVRFPHIDGDILVSIPDGNGGWFIGGDFDRTNLEDAFNFAHILPNMIPDSTFLPDFNNDVLALALINDTLFVGGQFTEIDGVAQPYLAAFSLTTESLLPWNLELDGRVKDLESIWQLPGRSR
jgi:hypothetical protein